MGASKPIHGICRDCGAAIPPSAQMCGQCGAGCILRHPELATLALAHVDCDAFYAAIEIRDNPALASGPVIVGGSVRGVVTAACYKARAFGVRSAMPMFQARKLCPDAVIVKPDGRKYSTAGKAVRQLMKAVTPLVEPISIDEAFLDLSGTERTFGAVPAQTLVRLAARIQREVGITVSVGLSYNKSLAKIASDFDKPDGFFVIGRAEAREFLADKPVRILWGVGPALERRLHGARLRTVGNIATRSLKELRADFGSTGARLARLARGEDSRPVNTARHQAKSASSSTTFFTDHSDPQILQSLLWGQCDVLAQRLKRARLGGRTVTLILKTSRFAVRTRATTLPAPTQLADALFRAALPRLIQAADGTKFRLIGIRVTDMSDTSVCDPPMPFDPGADRRAHVERIIDQVRTKLGANAIAKGRGFRPAHGHRDRRSSDGF